MEIKVVEKPRVSILFAEIKDGFVPPAYSGGVGFGRHFGAEGLWKKFYRKCEFLRGHVYGIVKTSCREKEIFYTRYKVFSPAVSERSVDGNGPEK